MKDLGEFLLTISVLDALVRCCCCVFCATILYSEQSGCRILHDMTLFIFFQEMRSRFLRERCCMYGQSLIMIVSFCFVSAVSVNEVAAPTSYTPLDEPQTPPDPRPSRHS